MLSKLWEATTSDPVALYAAILSTVIALAALVKWLTSGPRAWVELVNPKEVAATRNQSMEIIIANIGTDPFVVREIIVSMHKTKRSPAEHAARFFHGTPYDPAMQTIPNPNGKPNSSVRVPKVLRPGEEMHHHMIPVVEYDPSKHWLRAQVLLRQEKAPFIGWAAPIPGTGPVQADDLAD